MTSTLNSLNPQRSRGLHVAIIMDGNGRWAQLRGRPRVEGHRAGAAAIRRVIQAAPSLGVGTLTLYAFSTENWKRPAHEVSALMTLFRKYLASKTSECIRKGVAIKVVGRRDRLDPALVAAIEESEARTAHGSRLRLRLAVDYSARDAVLRAAACFPSVRSLSPADFSRAIAHVTHDDQTTPDVDLMIRTGAELRLSDLLGWDSGYAELAFSQKMWPDFSGNDLRLAVDDYWRRERRFGALPAESAQPVVAAGGRNAI